MNYGADLTKKNQIIIASYILFFILYIISVAFRLFTYNHLYFICSILFLLFIYLLSYTKISPRIIQLCIIVGMNVLILLLIFKASHILNIYWLIFYLILVSFYYSMGILILTSLIVCVEMVIFANNVLEHSHYFSDMKTLIALGTALGIVGINHSVFVYQKIKLDEKMKKEEMYQTLSKQAYLQLFFEHAYDAIAVFNLENKVINMNPAFEKLYGWKKEESIGRSLPLVPPHRMEEANLVFKELLEGKSYSIESLELKKDGTTFDAQVSLSPIYNKNGELVGVSLISRDITYLKENERLQMQSEKLKLAGEIAAGVAHEIRNPMTVISSFVQMMQMDKNSPYHSYINIVQEEIERINLIISEFLILSKPQMENKEWFDFIPLLHAISKLYEIEFQTKKIVFSFNTTLENAPFYGNKNQLKQVFINLLKNAMEAILTSGQIKIELSIQDDYYFISIHDNGCGISEEHLHHIFEPFYTTKTKGTGLGMMITNKIIQDHLGSIKVFSKENVGTDIHIQLPLSNQSNSL